MYDPFLYMDQLQQLSRKSAEDEYKLKRRPIDDYFLDTTNQQIIDDNKRKAAANALLDKTALEESNALLKYYQPLNYTEIVPGRPASAAYMSPEEIRAELMPIATEEAWRGLPAREANVAANTPGWHAPMAVPRFTEDQYRQELSAGAEDAYKRLYAEQISPEMYTPATPESTVERQRARTYADIEPDSLGAIKVRRQLMAEQAAIQEKQLKDAEMSASHMLSNARYLQSAGDSKGADQVFRMAAAAYKKYTNNPEAQYMANVIETEGKGLMAVPKAGAMKNSVQTIMKDGKPHRVMVNNEGGVVADLGETKSNTIMKDIPDSDLKYLNIALEKGLLTAADVTGRYSTKARMVIEGMKESERTGKPAMNYSADSIERKADASSLTKQTSRLDAAQSFVANLTANVQEAKNIAAQLTRTDIKVLNMPIRAAIEYLKGSGLEQSLNMILEEISLEAPKIASNSSDSIAAPSVGLQQSWRKIHDGTLPVRELAIVLDMTRKLANQRIGTLEDQKKKTIERIRPNGAKAVGKAMPYEAQLESLRKANTNGIISKPGGGKYTDDELMALVKRGAK